MPFRSKAQIEHFKKLHKEGKIGLGTIAAMSMGTPDELPDRIGTDNLKNQNQTP